MRCEDARRALSARLDGEAMLVLSSAVDGHLARCARCQEWLAGAQRVTRLVRIQPAIDVPDLTARILTAAYADGSLPPARRRVGVRTGVRARARTGARGDVGVAARFRESVLGLRWVLGALAVVQVMLAIPDLLGAVGHAAHAGREVAAFGIALGVGLILVACYPEYARVFAPVVATLVVCFASASAIDIAQGVVTPGHIAGHAVAVVQAGLVWLLARAGQRRPAAAS